MKLIALFTASCLAKDLVIKDARTVSLDLGVCQSRMATKDLALADTWCGERCESVFRWTRCGEEAKTSEDLVECMVKLYPDMCYDRENVASDNWDLIVRECHERIKGKNSSDDDLCKGACREVLEEDLCPELKKDATQIIHCIMDLTENLCIENW